jgi:hypothetical protein
MSAQPSDLRTDATADADAGSDDPAADVEAMVADLVPVVLPGSNDDFADALLLVAQGLGGHPDATAARATSLDPRGVDLVATVAGTEHASRVDFPEPVSTVDDLRMALLGLVSQAREASRSRSRAATSSTSRPPAPTPSSTSCSRRPDAPS